MEDKEKNVLDSFQMHLKVVLNAVLIKRACVKNTKKIQKKNFGVLIDFCCFFLFLPWSKIGSRKCEFGYNKNGRKNSEPVADMENGDSKPQQEEEEAIMVKTRVWL